MNVPLFLALRPYRLRLLLPSLFPLTHLRSLRLFLLPPPPASSGLPAWDIVGHKLFVVHTVILLINGRTVQSGTVATIIRLSARKRNWVCVRVCNSKVITWRAGFNLEFLH